MWASLLQSLKSEFGDKFNINEMQICYSNVQNKIKLPIEEKDIENNNTSQLTKDNILTYWNLLKSCKDIAKMYFFIEHKW